MSNEMNTQEEKKVLTQKDLNKAMFRWYMSAEMPLNFENMQGIAFCGSISHILKKLYTKKEDLSPGTALRLQFADGSVPVQVLEEREDA